MEKVNILWFRNGLRLHDNFSLHKAVQQDKGSLLPMFVFDGVTPVTERCSYNKMTFLLECLEDLDMQLRELGSRLYCFRGHPTEVLRKLSKKVRIVSLNFDQDCEPIWLERDNAVKNFCASHKIHCNEQIGATLWNPLDIIAANDGTPPLTYAHFCHVTDSLGPPPRPADTLDLSKVPMAELTDEVLANMNMFDRVPTPEQLGFVKTVESKVYKGGETHALKFFLKRIHSEKEAFLDGSFLPNRRDPDILNPPKSLSPDLKFGCISVRLFYWSVMEAFDSIYEENPKASYLIVNQLIWREFFYVMSTNNPFYDEIERNPICVSIPWYKDEKALSRFIDAKTGYPFIDAGITQLKVEGWIHHIVRNALSLFLTRGDLWLSWEHGLDLFLSQLIDGDWAVCAGNWMWVSSSAFEKSLNYSYSLDPRVYGRRIDPDGDYIRRFIPGLKNFPAEYIYDPSSAPLDVQESAGCVIGKDYPAPMIDHDRAVAKNTKMMLSLEAALIKKFRKVLPEHITPSNEAEVKNFFRLGISEGEPGLSGPVKPLF